MLDVAQLKVFVNFTRSLFSEYFPTLNIFNTLDRPRLEILITLPVLRTELSLFYFQMFSKEKEILSAFTEITGINCVPLTSYLN